MKISVNLNDYVYVRLNQHGMACWKKHWSVLPDRMKPEEVAAKREPDGRLKIQLHDLMATFGPMTYVGGWMPFVDGAVELV